MAIFGTLGENDLSAISASIADTAGDVFVYDTSKDSDGGAWRKRTTDTSWYNESAAANVRGSRQDFPSVAIIVAEAAQLTIYDGDDPDLPLWMRFTCSGTIGAACSMLPRGATGTENDITSISCLNAKLIVGLRDVDGSTGEGLIEVNFIPDYARVYRESGSAYRGAIYNQPISNRNVSTGEYYGDYNNLEILDQNILDVDMIVRPNADIDIQTGLPIPTVAVGSFNGITIIKEDGTTDLKSATTVGSYAANVSFTKDGNIIACRNEYNYIIVNPIDGDQTGSNISGFADNINYFRGDGINYPAPNGIVEGNQAYGLNARVQSLNGTNLVLSDPNGLNIFDIERNLPSTDNMVAYITSTYNTGYQVGDIKLALLSDTDTTDKTNGQTDPDRSYKDTNITVYGTVPKQIVATEATMVSYGPFSSSNYLAQAYNERLTFGTNDFSVMFWMHNNGTDVHQSLIGRDNREFAVDILNNTNYSRAFRIYANDSSNNLQLIDSNAAPFTPNTWNHVCVNYTGGNTATVYVNGVLNKTGTLNYDIDDTSHGLNIGARNTSGTYAHGATGTKLALVRISKYAPTASQIKKIYVDESCLFKEGAKCTLYGSSDAVTAIAYDEVTDQLHVGTSAGRSDFQGLRRINNTTDAVTTAISASNGLVAEQ